MTAPNLTKAVSLVMKEVHRLGAKDHNKFQDYNYTSVDDYKDHIRPLLAMHGLAIRTQQIAFSLEELTDKHGKMSVVARYDLQFALAHNSGEVEEPENVSIILPFIGAQTTGQARSYALKEWLKSKFLATSGNKGEDPDEHEQQEYTKTTPIRLPNDVTNKNNTSYAASNRDYAILVDDLQKQSTPEATSKWFADNQAKIKKLTNGGQWDVFCEMIKHGLSKCRTVLDADLYWVSHETRLTKLKSIDEYDRYGNLEDALINRVNTLKATEEVDNE